MGFLVNRAQIDVGDEGWAMPASSAGVRDILTIKAGGVVSGLISSFSFLAMKVWSHRRG
jgi:hypothetical protein